MLLSRSYILCLVFIEGAAVMAAELTGAKLIGPLYGNSLYIWAAVLGITLFSLTLGYYIGGWLSARFQNLILSLGILALIGGGLMLSVMPWLSLSIMTQLVEGDIVFGAVVSLLVFLFPTLFLFGLSSPLFISILNQEAGTSGKTSGFVYAISTLGGIISTFSFGFYLMGNFGITWPSFYLGLIVVLACCISIIWSRRYMLFLSLLPFFLFYNIYYDKNLVSGDTEIVYESEGIFGQIRVIDAPVETYLRGRHIGRTLYVNNVGQSTAFRDRLEYDSWDWSYFFPTVASVTAKGGDALLMGLGGGTIWHQYNRLGLNTEVVELDERIKNTAIQYFGVSNSANIIVDDARHFINTCRKTYDLITFDMFLNETPPAQVLSIETFLKVKKMLRPQGLWMINYFGYTEGTKGKSARSILKTLQNAGFHVEILVTPSEDESSRNVIFLASHRPIDFSKINYEEKDLPKITDITKYFLPIEYIDTNDAEILTDERPQFDHLYIEPSLDWRKRTIEYQIKPILESKINLIK